MRVRLAHPPGYDLDGGVISEAEEIARSRGGELVKDLSLEEAVRGAQVVYARSWQSLETYGNATLTASQRSRWVGWRIDEKCLSLGKDARLMHAMPVRRNVEVTDEVLDGPRSLLYEQAANRLTSQMALLVSLLR
jgi:ornithine carbamoyltransferase